MVSSVKAFNSFNKIVKSNFFEKNIYKPAYTNPAKFAKKMVLWSVLTKDAVGCYYYVTQSMNNERIPEDKRNFVAAIDLMNGILNVGLQFTVGKFIDKKSDTWFDSLVGKKLSTNKTREITSLVEKELKTHPAGPAKFDDIENLIRDKEILGKLGSKSKWLKVGFGAATMLIATQVITKRVIVPFLATPLAGWFKNEFMDKKEKKHENKNEDNKPNLDDKLLDHTSAPWAYSNQDGDKAMFKRVVSKA